MAIDRRQFLILAAGGAWLTTSLKVRTRYWLSCQRDSSGQYAACIITESGKTVSSITLPGRGHAIIKHPQRAEAVVLARRPGTFMVVIDLSVPAITARIHSLTGRHFYGHGVFNAEGRLLYVTENDFGLGTGVIGVYDAADGYRRLGEFSSYGIGPHELKFLNNGVTLAIANGGIRTHPDSGRARLNLSDMQSTLAYVDAGSGHLIATYHLPAALYQLSIRHIDVTANDKVFIAMQYKGAANRHPPLVATHQGEAALRLLMAPEPIQAAMRNYCGSVAVDSHNQVCAVTSPRGGLITLWSTGDEQFLGSSSLSDCCGIAAGNQAGEFLITNGLGKLVRLVNDNGYWTQTLLGAMPASSWDNHLTTVS